MPPTYQQVVIAAAKEAKPIAFAGSLSRWGYAVRCVHTSDGLIETLGVSKTDLVLLDESFVPQNKLASFVSMLKEHEKRTRIIIVYHDESRSWASFLQEYPVHGCFYVGDNLEKLHVCIVSVLKNLPKIDLIGQQFKKIKDQIRLSEKNKEGLRYIISSMPETISKIQPLDKLIRGILIQMCGFLNAEDSFLATLDENQKLIIQVGTGRFDVDEKTFLNLPFHTDHAFELTQATGMCTPTVTRQYMVLPLKAKSESVGVFYIEKSTSEFESLEEDMVKLFASQVSVTIENSNLFTLATQDGLTGLFVRRYFFERVRESLQMASRFGGQPVSFVITDIDHFKKINDTYGHPVGDKVLTEVAKVFKQNVRATDIVGRIGGEEFAIVFMNADTAKAFEIVEQLRAKVKQVVFTHEGKQFSVSFSAGLAGFPSYVIDRARLKDNDMAALLATDEKRMLAAADQALYYSKDHGRDQVTVGAIAQ